MTAIQQVATFEQKEGLLRTQSSTTASSQSSSQTGPKPRPLNFSRPLHRPTPSDTSSHHTQSTRTSSEWSANEDAALPPTIRTYTSRQPRYTTRPSSEWSNSEVADWPSPLRTRTNHDSFDLERLSVSESVDGAVPPPIKTSPGKSGPSYSRDCARPIVQPREFPVETHNPYTSQYQHERQSIASIAETDEADESYDSFATSTAGRPSTPDRPSTSDGQAPYQNVQTARSSVSDVSFDGQLGWNPRQPPLSEVRSQRWVGPPPQRQAKEESSGIPVLKTSQKLQQPQLSTAVQSEKPLAKTGTELSTASSSGASSTSTGPAPPIPHRIPRIVKRVSMDQVSEHINPRNSTSDAGSVSSSEWCSSECDTSVLSVEKIHNLKKKGINPALYVEMKNARKGKGKWVNPLGGSSFLA